MNPSDVDDGLELSGLTPEPPADASVDPESLTPPSPPPSSLSPPGLLRLAYALEFLIALIAIISMWSEIGGEGHLDLMPWYTKLGCILGLAWCSVRFTAGLVEGPKVWTRRTVGWFAGIVLFCIAMAGITYYYHLHEEQDDGDDDATTAAVQIDSLGTFFYHASKRTDPSNGIRVVARSAIPTGHRVPTGDRRGDPRIRL